MSQLSIMSFPNAELLFHQAFADPYPAPRLLQLLNKHKTYSAICDLTNFYFDAVAKDPFITQPLASMLSIITRSPDAPTYGRETLAEFLAEELAGTHFKYYDDDTYISWYDLSYLTKQRVIGCIWAYSCKAMYPILFCS